ncbi:MAG: class I SAM-dependent methyltransferase [Proteobacteria bacterium]|nr:class I SAM-dependent methyltransferase [Pseudomonadota bacterium]
MTIADVLNAVAPSLPGIVAQSALASSSGGAAIDIGHDDAALSSTRAREGQDGGLTQAVAEYSEAAEFPQGPRIPFIQFGRFLALADGVSLSLRGKRCVDFGCGAARPFSIASLMYLLGAESAIAIDVTPCADTAAIAKGLWFMLDALSAGNSGLEQYATYDLELVKARLIDFDADALRQGRLMEGLPKAIRHCVGDYLAIESELGVFDVMISNSVFEHIPDLDRTMRAFRKNLRQGGVIYADIDYRDHRFYVSGASPWQYLMDDDDVSPGYINKVRHAAMKQLVGNAGLRIVASAQVVTPAPPEVLQNMHARYRGASVDDLAVVQDSVLLQL